MSINKALLIICFLFILENTFGQKNGVAGYGRVESNVVFAELNRDVYLGAGGGVIVNDNLIFGAYLKALAKPYSFNAITTLNSFSESYNNPYSKNEDAFSTTINNIELGSTIGFNIAPEKPLQATFRALIGYSSVTFNEISLYEDTTTVDGFIIDDKTSVFSGFNGSVEVEGQFKIGKSFKVGLLAGYHLSYVNGRLPFHRRAVKRPFMFSGGYIGLGVSFGSFL